MSDEASSCRGFARWWPAAKVIRSALLVSDELLRSPGSLMLIAPRNNGDFVG